MNQQIPPPIETVLIKEEIADNCVFQDENVSEGEEAMDENDKFSEQESLENINDNMQYSSSSLCEESRMENFLNRVKKETGYNLIPEEIQIKDEHLFKATDSDSEDKLIRKELQNEGTNKPAAKRHRRYAVRPMNRERSKFCHFTTLSNFMKNNDEEQFFKYTRMSSAMFIHLLNLVKDSLTKDVTKNPLSPEQRLAMTLHYLAEGCSQQQISLDFYVGKATVHMVVKETTDVLWDLLSPIYVQIPSSAAEWEQIADGFMKKWNMPNCIGAIDGKHVRIQPPKHSGRDYFSLVLMASCDADYRFVMVDISAPGSNHDKTVFRNSGFGKTLLNNDFNIPNQVALPGTNTVLPYFVVADQAFPLSNHIMRPYPGERLTDEKKIFNCRISRARRCIENTFGILVQRWGVMGNSLITEVEMSERIVKACIALHNYVQFKETDLPLQERRYCPTGFADYIDVSGQLHLGHWRDCAYHLNPVGRMGSNNATRQIQRNRDELAQYLISDNGSVEWQWTCLKRESIPT